MPTSPAGDEPGEGQKNERLAAPEAVGQKRNHDRPDDAAAEHQAAQPAGLGDGEPARADDVFDPGGDSVEHSQPDKKDDHQE
jgi:hypothetical protein